MSEYQSLRDHDGGFHDDDPNQAQDWRANLATFGKKFGEQMTVVGGKISEQVTVVGDKMKEMMHTPTLGERLVDEATSDVLIGPDWEKNLIICDLINTQKVLGVDVVRGVKKRLAVKSGHVQLLALSVLETALKNCSSMFGDVAGEKVLDAMVRLVDDPTSAVLLREKCLKLIESWGEATDELRYLPVFEETYKSLKNRGIVFPPRDAESLVPIFTPAATHPTLAPGVSRPPSDPYPTYTTPAAAAVANGPPAGMFAYGGAEEATVPGMPGVRSVQTAEGSVIVLDSKEIMSVARNSVELLSTVISSAPPEEVVKDELVSSLAAQCRASKRSVQRLVENESQNETLLFEALTVNDELDKVLEKLAELQQQFKTDEPGAAGAAAPGQPSPPGPAVAQVPIFAVPSGEGDTDGGEALVRKRNGVGEDGAAAAGDHSGQAAVDDDEKALAELDAMVFGKAPAPPVAQGGASTQSQGQGEGKEEGKKDDDLIVF